MKRETFYANRNRSGNLLHIETDGCIVNIRPGLHDHEGREVTSVEIVTDRTPDEGRTWALDGYTNSRVVRLLPGETELPGDPDTLTDRELACLATTAVELWEAGDDGLGDLSGFQQATLAKARTIHYQQMEP